MNKAFSLIEFIVVVAVIAALTALFFYLINPFQVVKRSRDATRLLDIADLQQAILATQQDATGSANLSLCNGKKYPCSGSSLDGGNNVNGTGWLPVNLSGQKAANVPTLPVDPINDQTYHYVYCADGDQWEISTRLESNYENYKMTSDGGNDNNLFERGTNLTLIAPNVGSCRY